MNFNVVQALTYIKEEKNWIVKVLIMYIFILITGSIEYIISLVKSPLFTVFGQDWILANLDHIVPLLYTFYGFAIIFIIGYFTALANNRIYKFENNLLSWKDAPRFFLTGLKGCIFLTIAALPLVAIFFATAKIISVKILLYSAISAFILSLFIGLYYSIAYPIFCSTLKFKSFFNLSSIKKVITENKNSYLLYLFTVIGMMTVTSASATFLGIIPYVGVFIAALIKTFASFVITDIISQFMANIIKIEKSTEA